ncbi:MAG: LysE family transporter [Pyramidobacter sp.]|nr:LysE family transporter [Pyramidobacter sp.]
MNLLSFLGYVLATVFTPGPNNISSMSNAGRYGFGASLRYRLGIYCGFFIVQSLAALFSAVLLDVIPAVQPYMLALGAVYILWMAWKTFTSAPSGDALAGEARDNTFLSGLLLQFVNVKVILFAITTMSVYAVPYSSSPAFLLAFGFVMATCAFVSINCWAAFGAVFSRVLRRHERAVNVVMALLLVWCAVALYL